MVDDLVGPTEELIGVGLWHARMPVSMLIVSALAMCSTASSSVRRASSSTVSTSRVAESAYVGP